MKKKNNAVTLSVQTPCVLLSAGHVHIFIFIYISRYLCQVYVVFFFESACLAAICLHARLFNMKSSY